MLDIGWQELLVIGALALIVVGPKDLPSLLRSVGQWVGRMRGMARDFQRAMNDAARDADLNQMKELRDLKNTVSGNLDFKEQASKAQSFLNSTAADPEKPATKTEDEDPGMVDNSGGGNRAMTSSAPVDKPDPSAMGGADYSSAPIEETKPDKEPSTAPTATPAKAAEQ